MRREVKLVSWTVKVLFGDRQPGMLRGGECIIELVSLQYNGFSLNYLGLDLFLPSIILNICAKK